MIYRDGHNALQAKAGLFKIIMKDILFNKAGEQISIGWHNKSDHGSSLTWKLKKWFWVRMNWVTWIRN